MFSICFFRYCTFFLWAPLVESFDSYGVQGGNLIELNILYKMLCIIYHLNLNQSIKTEIQPQCVDTNFPHAKGNGVDLACVIIICSKALFTIGTL